MANALKTIVSKKKHRYVGEGFNLDLSYITDRLIAMGFPSVWLESLYRNAMDDVKRFLDEKHFDHYYIYNLCPESERVYDAANFYNRVANYPFEDHHPPRFTEIKAFCEDVTSWLHKDQKNVAVVHCKAGKGRTGVMICCYLLHSRLYRTAEEALNYYGKQRTQNEKGVTIPSQRRYIDYYAEFLQKRLEYKPTKLYLSTLVLDPVPSFNTAVGVVDSYQLQFVVHQPSKPSFESPWYHVKRSGRQSRLDVDPPLLICDDVKFEFYVKPRIDIMKSKFITAKLSFHFWLNTFFVAENISGGLAHDVTTTGSPLAKGKPNRIKSSSGDSRIGCGGGSCSVAFSDECGDHEVTLSNSGDETQLELSSLGMNGGSSMAVIENSTSLAEALLGNSKMLGLDDDSGGQKQWKHACCCDHFSEEMGPSCCERLEIGEMSEPISRQVSTTSSACSSCLAPAHCLVSGQQSSSILLRQQQQDQPSISNQQHLRVSGTSSLGANSIRSSYRSEEERSSAELSLTTARPDVQPGEDVCSVIVGKPNDVENVEDDSELFSEDVGVSEAVSKFEGTLTNLMKTASVSEETLLKERDEERSAVTFAADVQLGSPTSGNSTNSSFINERVRHSSVPQTTRSSVAREVDSLFDAGDTTPLDSFVSSDRTVGAQMASDNLLPSKGSRSAEGGSDSNGKDRDHQPGHHPFKLSLRLNKLQIDKTKNAKIFGDNFSVTLFLVKPRDQSDPSHGTNVDAAAVSRATTSAPCPTFYSSLSASVADCGSNKIEIFNRSSSTVSSSSPSTHQQDQDGFFDGCFLPKPQQRQENASNELASASLSKTSGTALTAEADQMGSNSRPISVGRTLLRSLSGRRVDFNRRVDSSSPESSEDDAAETERKGNGTLTSSTCGSPAILTPLHSVSYPRNHGGLLTSSSLVMGHQCQVVPCSPAGGDHSSTKITSNGSNNCKPCRICFIEQNVVVPTSSQGNPVVSRNGDEEVHRRRSERQQRPRQQFGFSMVGESLPSMAGLAAPTAAISQSTWI